MTLTHLEVEIAAEAPRAVWASVGLGVRVGVHVEREVVNLMERLVADMALVRLHCTVRQSVVLVVPCKQPPLPHQNQLLH